MMGRYTRRAVLAGCVTTGVALAGCKPDYPPEKRLVAEEIVVTQTNGQVEVELSVTNENTYRDEDGDFHDVTVLGYTDDGSTVCEHSTGTVAHDVNGVNKEEIAMSCTAEPTMITFSATESPCYDAVTIHIAVYDEDRDVWSKDIYSRECSEGLPPEPRG